MRVPDSSRVSLSFSPSVTLLASNAWKEIGLQLPIPCWRRGGAVPIICQGIPGRHPPYFYWSPFFCLAFSRHSGFLFPCFAQESFVCLKQLKGRSKCQMKVKSSKSRSAKWRMWHGIFALFETHEPEMSVVGFDFIFGWKNSNLFSQAILRIKSLSKFSHPGHFIVWTKYCM